MGNVILYLFVCLVIPIFMSMHVLRGRSRSLIFFMICGMFACLFAGQINSLIIASTGLDIYDMTTSVSPVVEEIIKSIPILTLFFAFKPDRQFVLESSVMVGIGFSLLENGYILLSNVGEFTFVFALIRGLGSAMLHVVTTVCVGLGVSMFAEEKRTILIGTYATLLAAMVFHAIYNMFIQSESLMYLGIVLPTLAFSTLVFIVRKQLKSLK